MTVDSYVLSKRALDECHKHSFNNKAEIGQSKVCHCFHCEKEFSASEIRRWISADRWKKLRGYVGLTGGIASGKSTVARILRELGVSVVDADVVAREVVAPGTVGLEKVVEAFGTGVLQDDGTLDRKKLGALVFSDPAELKRLEKILHPLIGERAQLQLDTILTRGERVAVYESAIMVETNLHKKMDYLVVVAASEEVQLARVMARDGLDEVEAKKRIAAQFPLEKKIEKARAVIWNNGSEDELRDQVKTLFEKGLHHKEDTAVCPKCGIDAVIGDASGYEMTSALLHAMHEFWFERKVLPDDFDYSWFEPVKG
jgi:dephospho-CoA kinase